MQRFEILIDEDATTAASLVARLKAAGFNVRPSTGPAVQMKLSADALQPDILAEARKHLGIAAPE